MVRAPPSPLVRGRAGARPRVTDPTLTKPLQSGWYQTPVWQEVGHAVVFHIGGIKAVHETQNVALGTTAALHYLKDVTRLSAVTRSLTFHSFLLPDALS